MPITSSDDTAVNNSAGFGAMEILVLPNGNAATEKKTANNNRILIGTVRLPNIGAVITTHVTRVNINSKMMGSCMGGA